MIMNQILSIIKESKTIAITAHTSADGDALGSVMALTLGLRSIGKNVYILSKEKVQKGYSFLPLVDEINNLNKFKENTDCVLVLDCGNSLRINSEIDLSRINGKVINIDHHISNEMYGTLNYVDPNASAVGEIIYQMLMMLGIEISKPIAECLYTAIITDSGSFKYSNTTSITHGIAGYLINTGINFNEIHRLAFENKSFDRLKIYGRVLDSMKLEIDNKLCIMKITKKMLDDIGIKEIEDASDIVSLGVQIEGVEVAALFKETDKGIRISLRSKEKVDVRKVAEEFGGGGHTKAAGLTIDSSLDEAISILTNVIREFI